MNKEEIEELAFKDRKELANLNELDLLEIIEFLQLDRKQWINQFSKTHNESIDIQKEKQELKQKYLNAVADYETTMSELQELKKQIEECKNAIDQIVEFEERLEEEKKIPEKLDEYDFERGNQRELAEKVNEIIDYLKSKGE